MDAPLGLEGVIQQHIVLVIGSKEVGKTSLLKRLGAAEPAAAPTLEDEEGGAVHLLTSKAVLISHTGKRVHVTFVEVAAGAQPSVEYLYRASAIICVVDVVDRDSTEPVRHLLSTFAHTRRDDITPVIVGNKIDLVAKRTRHHTTFHEQAKEWGLAHYIALQAAEHVSYMVTSATTGEHCDTLKEKIIFMLPDVPPTPDLKMEHEHRHWCILI